MQYRENRVWSDFTHSVHGVTKAFWVHFKTLKKETLCFTWNDLIKLCFCSQGYWWLIHILPDPFSTTSNKNQPFKMRDSTSHHPVMRSVFVTGLFQIVGGMTLFFSGLLLVIMRFDEPYRNRFENPVCGVWAGGVSRSFMSGFLNYCRSTALWWVREQGLGEGQRSPKNEWQLLIPSEQVKGVRAFVTFT